MALATLQPSPFWVFISYILQKMTKAEKSEILKAPMVGYWSGCGGLEFKRFDYGINDYAVFVAGRGLRNHPHTVQKLDTT